MSTEPEPTTPAEEPEGVEVQRGDEIVTMHGTEEGERRPLTPESDETSEPAPEPEAPEPEAPAPEA
jgi:hypothetical protein